MSSEDPVFAFCHSLKGQRFDSGWLKVHRVTLSHSLKSRPHTWDSAPRYLLRDRDRIFGDDFSKQVQDMAIQEVLSAPRSPWQRAYVKRVIGTTRRERLDHVIVFNEASLYHHVKSFMTYYHESRTHLSLGKDSPESRAVQPPELGRIVAIPQVGGLHHRYERHAA